MPMPSAARRHARVARPRALQLLGVLLLCAMLAACGDETPPPPDPAQRAEQEAAQAADLYRQLRELGRLEQAELAGRNVLEKYPDSAAAAEVRQTYEALRAEVESTRESGRLAGLWTYHAVPEGESAVYTATIHRDGDDPAAATDPTSTAEGVRLVLRQHPAWGQAVYLLASNGDFDCAEEGCKVRIAVDDGAQEEWEATVSHEGPLPALFVEDDERFIEALERAAWVRIEAPMASAPQRPLAFEVDGFERSAWLADGAGAAASDAAAADTDAASPAATGEAADTAGDDDAG